MWEWVKQMKGIEKHTLPAMKQISHRAGMYTIGDVVSSITGTLYGRRR